jgi:hypothetical protein
MSLVYTPHKKLSLKTHPHFNEAWLHERIEEDPSILGLGDVRVLSHEKPLPGGGRLDLLLYDEDNNRRYEVEIMLGATDPSHIIRTIEYWDLERRRYPGYEHVAVLVAEDVTARFLNVLGLMSGSIPIVAIQLDALEVQSHIVLNFVQVLDQADLRTDDGDDDGGGGPVDRAHWSNLIGERLLGVCDAVVREVNEHANGKFEPSYMRHYIGLRSNGVVNNLVYMAPKKTKNFVHIGLRSSNADDWRDRFEEAGVPARSQRKRRVTITVSPEEHAKHRELIAQAIADTVQQSNE